MHERTNPYLQNFLIENKLIQSRKHANCALCKSCLSLSSFHLKAFAYNLQDWRYAN